MAISFHMDSVSIGQMGGGLIQHIDRDMSNVDKVIEDNRTKSHISRDLTDFNVRFDSEAEGMDNFEKAKALVMQRQKDRYDASGVTWTADDDKKLKELQHDNSVKRKRFKSSEKKSKTSKTTLAREKAWHNVKAQMEKMKARRKQSQTIGSLNEPAWNDQVSVAYTHTHQLSYESLEAMGWQHEPDKVNASGITVVKGRLFNYLEQKKYEEDNQISPDDSGIQNVTNAYKAVRKGVIDHPEVYGALITSAIHFDEDSPHLDLMTLNIGQNLDGTAIDGHIGEPDNGTDDNLLSIRGRTFRNGTNAKGGGKFLNQSWSEHLQDVNGEIMHEEIDKACSHADDWQIKRGISKKDRKRQATNTMRNARFTAQSVDSLVTSAEDTASSAKADNATTMIMTAKSIASAQSMAKNVKSMAESASASLSIAQSSADASIASASASIAFASSSNDSKSTWVSDKTEEIKSAHISISNASDSMNTRESILDAKSSGMASMSRSLDSKSNMLSDWDSNLSNTSVSLTARESNVVDFEKFVDSKSNQNSLRAHNLKVKNDYFESNRASFASSANVANSSIDKANRILKSRASSIATHESSVNTKNHSATAKLKHANSAMATANAKSDEVVKSSKAVTKRSNAVSKKSEAVSLASNSVAQMADSVNAKSNSVNHMADSVAHQSSANNAQYQAMENLGADVLGYFAIGANSTNDTNYSHQDWLDIIQGKSSFYDDKGQAVSGFKAIKPLATNFLKNVKNQIFAVKPASMRPIKKKEIETKLEKADDKVNKDAISLNNALDASLEAHSKQSKPIKTKGSDYGKQK